MKQESDNAACGPRAPPTMNKARLRPWLEMMINNEQIPGLRWVNGERTKFKIPWKHHGKQDWNPENSQIFMEWAIHTGRFRVGVDKEDYPTWKTRMRCAFNKAPDILEVKEESNLDSPEPFRVYQLTDRRRSHSGRVSVESSYSTATNWTGHSEEIGSPTSDSLTPKGFNVYSDNALDASPPHFSPSASIFSSSLLPTVVDDLESVSSVDSFPPDLCNISSAELVPCDQSTSGKMGGMEAEEEKVNLTASSFMLSSGQRESHDQCDQMLSDQPLQEFDLQTLLSTPQHSTSGDAQIQRSLSQQKPIYLFGVASHLLPSLIFEQQFVSCDQQVAACNDEENISVYEGQFALSDPNYGATSESLGLAEQQETLTYQLFDRYQEPFGCQQEEISLALPDSNSLQETLDQSRAAGLVMSHQSEASDRVAFDLRVVYEGREVMARSVGQPVHVVYGASAGVDLLEGGLVPPQCVQDILQQTAQFQLPRWSLPETSPSSSHVTAQATMEKVFLGGFLLWMDSSFDIYAYRFCRCSIFHLSETSSEGRSMKIISRQPNPTRIFSSADRFLPSLRSYAEGLGSRPDPIVHLLIGQKEDNVSRVGSVLIRMEVVSRKALSDLEEVEKQLARNKSDQPEFGGTNESSDQLFLDNVLNFEPQCMDFEQSTSKQGD